MEWGKLPWDCQRHILQYTGKFKERVGKWMGQLSTERIEDFQSLKRGTPSTDNITPLCWYGFIQKYQQKVYRYYKIGRNWETLHFYYNKCGCTYTWFDGVETNAHLLQLSSEGYQYYVDCRELPPLREPRRFFCGLRL